MFDACRFLDENMHRIRGSLVNKRGGKVCIQAKWPIRPDYPGFCYIKRLGAFLLTPGWDASPSQGYPPSIKFAGTHLYTWVESGTVRVKCLAQEHNKMSPARTRNPTARCGVELANQEATGPPRIKGEGMIYFLRRQQYC